MALMVPVTLIAWKQLSKNARPSVPNELDGMQQWPHSLQNFAVPWLECPQERQAMNADDDEIDIEGFQNLP